MLRGAVQQRQLQADRRRGAAPLRLTYLLPIRRDAPLTADEELSRYVRGLGDAVDEVLVVDGSPPPVFTSNAAALGGSVQHLSPAPADRCANGKAWGVITGIRAAAGDAVVIADDDVRWSADALARATALLRGADLVIPQNHFSPMVWHAAWDTGRTLLNRATGHDWPGTLVLRRTVLDPERPYDGNVLFENCELVRTVRARSGRVHVARDLFVARRPPTLRHFLDQRPRQAYDDVAEPRRFISLLAVLPLAARGRWRGALLLACATVALAERGRRRDRGTTVFPWYTAWCAPLWLAERSVMSWWTLWRWLSRRGATYGGRRFLVAAHSEARLRRGPHP